ncbi:MAG: alpha/beta hydrolase [Caryophanon sp.]|nr:alpha/beta hydrolase [Caryophanon sp.]
MAEIDSLHHVTIQNGETLTYRKRTGGDDVIVLIHGNMTSSKHWDLLMENLDERYTIYAMDLRGFGGSTYDERVTSIRDFSEDVKAIIDHLELTDFTVVGWSTGGNVAMQLCADYPNLAKKLVLFASGSTRGFPFYNPFQQRVKTLQEIENDIIKTIPMKMMYDGQNREGLRLVWNSTIYTHNQPESERYERYIDDMLTQRNLPDVYHALNQFNISDVGDAVSDGTSDVDNIQIPTLILYGDRDLVVTKKMTNEIIEDFDGRATVVELENCGHSPLIDQLDLVVEHIEQFA